MNTCIHCKRQFNASWVVEYGGGPVEEVDFCSPDCSINYYNRKAETAP